MANKTKTGQYGVHPFIAALLQQAQQTGQGQGTPMPTPTPAGPPTNPYIFTPSPGGGGTSVPNPAWTEYWRNNPSGQQQMQPPAMAPASPAQPPQGYDPVQTQSQAPQAPTGQNTPAAPLANPYAQPAPPQAPNADIERNRAAYDAIMQGLRQAPVATPLNPADYDVNGRPRRGDFQEFDADAPQRDLRREASAGNKNALWAALGGLLLGGGTGALTAFTGARGGFDEGANRVDAENVRRYQQSLQSGELKYQDALAGFQDSTDAATRRLAIDTANQAVPFQNYAAANQGVNTRLGVLGQAAQTEQGLRAGENDTRRLNASVAQALPAMQSYLGNMAPDQQAAAAQAINAAFGYNAVPVPGTQTPDGSTIPAYQPNLMDRANLQTSKAGLIERIRPVLGNLGPVGQAQVIRSLGLETDLPVPGTTLPNGTVVPPYAPTIDQQALLNRDKREGRQEGRMDNADRRAEKMLTLQERQVKLAEMKQADDAYINRVKLRLAAIKANAANGGIKTVDDYVKIYRELKEAKKKVTEQAAKRRQDINKTGDLTGGVFGVMGAAYLEAATQDYRDQIETELDPEIIAYRDQLKRWGVDPDKPYLKGQGNAPGVQPPLPRQNAPQTPQGGPAGTNRVPPAGGQRSATPRPYGINGTTATVK